MLPIYICDDNEFLLSQLNMHISAYMNMHYENSTPSIYAFSDPHVFLDNYNLSDTAGIYFLDIDFKTDITGLDLAEKIRQKDPLGFIIFVTTHDNYISETYKRRIGALDYIIKDDGNLNEQISNTLTTALKRYQTVVEKTDVIPNRLHLNIKKASIILEQNSIIYIEAVPGKHSIDIYHGTSKTTAYYSLADVFEKLDKKYFVMCHRSIVVNILYIKEIDTAKKTIYLTNGTKLSISRRNANKLHEMLNRR